MSQSVSSAGEFEGAGAASSCARAISLPRRTMQSATESLSSNIDCQALTQTYIIIKVTQALSSGFMATPILYSLLPFLLVNSSSTFTMTARYFELVMSSAYDNSMLDLDELHRAFRRPGRFDQVVNCDLRAAEQGMTRRAPSRSRVSWGPSE